MTAPQLVTPEYTASVAASEKPKYTPAETATIQAYQAALSAGRYYKLYDSRSQYARIISAEDPEPLPLSFLSDDFRVFCKETGRRLPATLPNDLYLGYALKLVTGTAFVPNGPDLIRKPHSRHQRVNVYKRFEHKHPAIELSPLFLDFLRCLFPVPSELHIFCQYIAHAILFPEQRPSWHLMLPSESGVGKGFIFNDIISPLFAMQTKLVKSFGALTGKFGGTVLEGSIFTMLDDCKTGSESTETQMKSMLSEERIYIEKKGKDGTMETICTRFVLASNEDVPTPVDEQTRRWCIFQKLAFSDGLKGKVGQQERQVRIKALAAWLKLPGAMEAVYDYFAGYSLDATADYPEFDYKNVPITDSFEQMVAKSETPEESFAADFLDSHATKVFKMEDFLGAFVSGMMGKLGNTAAADLLRKLGYRKALLTKPSRGRWWLPAGMTDDQAEAILMEKSAEQPF